MRNLAWDSRKKEEVEVPQEMSAFLKDLETVCRKHGLVVGLDRHDELAVQALTENRLELLLSANKDYLLKAEGSAPRYKFERTLEKNLVDMSVIDARRFGAAVRSAMRELNGAAGCHKLYNEDYYLDTQAFLEQMASRLSAEPVMEE